MRSATPATLRVEAVFACERVEFFQALVLELSDPLAGEIESAPELVEGGGVAALQPEVGFEDLALAGRECVE